MATRSARLFGPLGLAVLIACCWPAAAGVSTAARQVVSARAGLVTRAEGEVLRRAGGASEPQPLREGARLTNGDAVVTAPKGHADWSLTPDSYLHVGADSYVRVYETSLDRMHFDVERGEVVVVVRRLAEGAALVIHLPPGPMTVRKAGRYRFRVAESGEAEALVAKGELSYVENGKEVSLKKRTRVNFYRAAKRNGGGH